ncbi:unnamed protein product [Protopolystoma xenopodis]|uniref:Uncharacterized protein n=1 Tax=Protopolystoma xenopodis TaxID=117903 RepID=A0A3S5A688_9PLAT|nr:unnamed protein product [Protopolystoma xenopodis]
MSGRLTGTLPAHSSSAPACTKAAKNNVTPLTAYLPVSSTSSSIVSRYVESKLADAVQMPIDSMVNTTSNIARQVTSKRTAKRPACVPPTTPLSNASSGGYVATSISLNVATPSYLPKTPNATVPNLPHLHSDKVKSSDHAMPIVSTSKCSLTVPEKISSICRFSRNRQLEMACSPKQNLFDIEEHSQPFVADDFAHRAEALSLDRWATYLVWYMYT